MHYVLLVMYVWMYAMVYVQCVICVHVTECILCKLGTAETW